MIIQLNNISKIYPHQHVALQNATMHLEKGEMAFLTGHSGAGKSTLLKLIALIERPTQGQLFVAGKNLKKLPKWRIPYLRRIIGVIFQDPNLLNQQTVFTNVALPLLIAGRRRAEIAKKVRAALDMVGLLQYEKQLPLELSGGEQQRVGIARAIVNRPPLLLADEPTGNLDPELSLDIMRLFEQLNASGVSVLIATHDLALISALQHRVITLKAGNVVKGEEFVC